MKLINKSILTIIFSLFTIVAFAQRSDLQQDLSRDLNRDLSSQLNTGTNLNNPNLSPGPNEASGGGGAPNVGDQFVVPIDDYQYYLLALAALSVGIVAYRRRQVQQA